MTHPQTPLTIIGSGLASYVFAKSFRALDADRPLRIITADDGYFYNKPQLSTALTQGKTADMLVTSTAEEMAEILHAEIITHTRVNSIHREAKQLICGDHVYSYHQLVLAIGSQVLTPDFPGDAHDHIFSVNTLTDYRAWRSRLEGIQHVAVIGGGLVGTEFAQDLVNAGIKVDLIHDCPTPINRLLPNALGHILMEKLAERGVNWHMSTMVNKINTCDGGVRLTLANGEVLDAQVVLSSVGIGCTTGLAESAGLAVSSGIQVNRLLQTSDPYIYALGDCVEVDGVIKQYIAPLRKQAESLAQTLTGTPTEVVYPAMPVNVKTPSCPTTICPVPPGTDGQWRIEGDAPDLEAYFTDAGGQLRGFALTGSAVRLRQTLLKTITGVFG